MYIAQRIEKSYTMNTNIHTFNSILATTTTSASASSSASCSFCDCFALLPLRYLPFELALWIIEFLIRSNVSDLILIIAWLTFIFFFTRFFLRWGLVWVRLNAILVLHLHTVKRQKTFAKALKGLIRFFKHFRKKIKIILGFLGFWPFSTAFLWLWRVFPCCGFMNFLVIGLRVG